VSTARPTRPLLVRAARPAEHDTVGELTVRVYTGAGYLRPGSPYVHKLRDAASRAEKAELLVAVAEDGAVLGSVTYAPGGSPYAETAEADDEAGFRMLVVDPAARGQGVGAALVRACIERAEQAGARKLRLSTQPQMTAAHRLYERLGFTRTPDHDWTPEPGVDLLTYALELSPAGR
jgi:ribosomal protein S18 acetylase RimI-like enzyme